MDQCGACAPVLTQQPLVHGSITLNSDTSVWQSKPLPVLQLQRLEATSPRDYSTTTEQDLEIVHLQ